MGVANDHSIAWGIARAFARGRARELAFTYQGEAFGKRRRSPWPSASAPRSWWTPT